ncbi:MAG: HEAT repeat domain-containing protein [Myxococcales bacterium]|nr:HEAT repeat domain-containing protein [Myxococcales bacterium]
MVWRTTSVAVRLGSFLVFVVTSLAAFGVSTAAAQGDPRTEYLTRLLTTSTSFRVRAQAALSLGRLQGNTAASRALAIALREDEHPAVRTAAAAALEQVGDTSPQVLSALETAVREERDRAARDAASRALASLRRLARMRPPASPSPASGAASVDPSPPPASSGPARYYVGIGVPGTRVASIDRETLERARAFIERNVAAMEGVRLAPANESNEAARRVLSRDRLTGYYLDSSIVSLEQSPAGTRAVVSVIVGTYPGRDMRVILQGAATVQGGSSGPTIRQQAIEGALSGALRRLPQAFAAGDARGGG